jgi:flagellar motor switch/type III secretory pathway protein FliN
VSDALLDNEELEAIQDAIRQSAPRRSNPAIEASDAAPLALIADDRLAEAARPVLINLATRWTRLVHRALRSHLPAGWQLDVVGAEVIDGQTAKEELRGAWVGALQSQDAELVIAVHGGVIDIAAARRCGASSPTADANRVATGASLRLFHPAGRVILESFGAAWREVFDKELPVSTDLAVVARLIETRSLVRVALAFNGSSAGRVQIYARPEALVPRPLALAAIKANTQLVANALANVPVEVVVELGTLRMRMRELRALDPGTTLTLPGFVDSRVPVFCEGTLKAWGRPVVSRGVLAVQIVSIVHGQGAKS